MKKSKSHSFFLKMLPTVLCALALTITSCGGNADQGTPSAASSDIGVTQGESELDTARVYELANGNPLVFYESDVKALRSELTLYEDGTYTLTRIEEYPGYTFEYRGETVTVDYKTVCYTSGGKYGYRKNADGTEKDDEIFIIELSKNKKISVPPERIDAIVENACEHLTREEDRERVRAEYSDKGYDYIYEYDDNEGGSSYRLDDAVGKAYLAGWKSYEITGYPVYNEQGVITRYVREDHISGVVWVTEYLYDEDGALTGYAETETAEEHGYLTGDHVRVETNEYSVNNGKLVKTHHKVVYDGEVTEEEYYTETSYVPIPPDKDTWITPTEDGVFGEDYIYDFPEPETEKIENAPLTTVRLGAKEIEAYRTETVRGTDATSRDGFQTADDMYKFWKYKYNSSFYISGMDTKTALSDYPYSELTEERLYDHVVAYIRSFLPDIKIEKYVLSVNTGLTVTAEDSAWSDTKDGFYIGRETENTKESVTGYNYTFALYCNGIPTGDFVCVLCGPDGAVLSLQYSCFDVDWSAAKYDLEKSRKKALAFAASALNDRYSVKSAKTVSERLNYENGFFRLQFDVELVTNEGFATLCTVIITP